MKIIIKNQESTKKVFINGIDFDMMTEEFQIKNILSILDRNELKSVFLHALKEKNFDMTKSNDENGVVIELWRKENKQEKK
jgi:hypothetical protein